jgi:hypothetical protein
MSVQMLEEPDSRVYHGYRTSRDVPPARLIEVLRGRYPGATIHVHVSMLEALGAAPDLAVHKWAQPGEAFVQQPAEPIMVTRR